MGKQNRTPLQGLSNLIKGGKFTKNLSAEDTFKRLMGKETSQESELKKADSVNQKIARRKAKKENKAKAIADGPQKRFLGILNTVDKDKLERTYNTSMLKAYLKGGSEFAFGYRTVTNEFGASIRAKNYLPVVFEDKTLDPAATQKLLSGGFTNRGCQFVRNTPGAKRTSHAEIKDRKFQKEEDAREKEVEEFNKEVKKFNKGKKKAEKVALKSFTRKLHRPGSKAESESKLGL